MGGVISQLTPALALFYGQTANKKTINYFYRNNIRINNTLLLLVFSGLALQLNLVPENGGILNRNVLLGCHKPNTSYTLDEFAYSIHFVDDFLEVNGTTSSTDFPFKNWTARDATSSEYAADDHPTGTNTSSSYRNKYLIAPDCKPGQSSVKMLNMIAVPVIYGLWLVSTLTSWCVFDMR